MCVFDLLGSQGAASDVAGYAELCLEVFCGGNMDMQLVQGDCVADFEARGIASPATLIASVKEAIAEEDKVARAHPLPRDLLQLSFFQQFPARSDELPVSKARLQFQHGLELIL